MKLTEAQRRELRRADNRTFRDYSGARITPAGRAALPNPSDSKGDAK
jgi:hypothetical protein